MEDSIRQHKRNNLKAMGTYNPMQLDGKT